MIETAGDITAAYEAGRWHTQRFIKTSASQIADGRWQDWAYSAGQPAYDARIGVGGAFNPAIATRNDAIWFPDIPSGMERKLAGLAYRPLASGSDQLTCDIQVYDLLGYYPLLDGDSTDTQTMDNTLTLPRYANGEGVMAVLVNHVAPGTAQAAFTINYTNNMGNSRTMTGITTTSGVNQASWTLGTSTVTGPLYLPLDARCRGIQRIDDITFTTPPGGLWCIYLVKPMCVAVNRANPLTGANSPIMSLKCLCSEDSFRMPTVYDGAHLGFFFMPNGASRSDTFYGYMTFLWG